MKGLSWNFNIADGKLNFTADAEKARENILFLFHFIDNSRIYLRDFGPNLAWLQQKPSSYVQLYRPLIISDITGKLIRYVPFVNIEGLYTDYSRVNKRYFLGVRYSFKNELVNFTDETVTFV